MSAAAQAHPNIALVKYWGKRDAQLNLPACGSLSITLDTLDTRTRVCFDHRLATDQLSRDGQTSPRELARVSACLDLLRERAGVSLRADVQTSNSFPTGAGLASSASGFAALVVAGSAALGLDLDPRELSLLARQGSGSAARSIFGGFAEMAAGERADGQDAYASALLAPEEWPLSVVVAVTSDLAKDTGSSVGMERSRSTSPFYPAWVEGGTQDLAIARRAVAERDFAALARVSEHSCLKMHATMLSSTPGLIYWSGATVDCLHRIRSLRDREGMAAFFTVDAGPQVKAVCLPADAERVAEALREIPGVQSVLITGLGQGAHVVQDDVAS